MRVKGIAVSLATMLLSGSLAFAQMCPPGMQTVCLMHAQTTATMPHTGQVGMQPTLPQIPQATLGVTPVCPIANVSPETACLLAEMAALRGEMRTVRGELRASALELRGQQLLSRMQQLMTDEMLMRQRLAAEPNWPGAQQEAMRLSAEAAALNRDIAAFSNELALIPQDQRPFIAQRLQTFETVYWNPTVQQFATYGTQFPQTAAVYQPAFQANPWLQAWHTTYQTTLAQLGQAPQTFAAARWWTGVQVLGTAEVYPNNMTGQTGVIVLPPGSAIYIPPTAMGTGTTAH